MVEHTPLHQDAATRDDVRHGQVFVVINTFLGETYKGRFNGRPFERNGQLRAHAATVPSARMSDGGVCLADLGIVPYPDGRWNRSNYTVIIPADRARLTMPGSWLLRTLTDEQDEPDPWLG